MLISLVSIIWLATITTTQNFTLCLHLYYKNCAQLMMTLVKALARLFFSSLEYRLPIQFHYAFCSTTEIRSMQGL
jgi:hypothetical protein